MTFQQLSKPVAAFAIALFSLALVGCHTVPLGDPDKSTADAKLAGWWGPEKPGMLIHVFPYDKHTYVMTCYGYEFDGDKIKPQSQFTTKAWHTSVAGMDLITAKIINPEWDLTAGKDVDARYSYYRITRTDDAVEVRALDIDFLKDTKTPAELEKKIADNAKNPQLFGKNEPAKLTRVPDSKKDDMKKVLDAFNPAKSQ
ncbi:MAG: hypothetical protein JWM97_1525 [Phycisphaerales bacterium]|jgi:hypothetical protein|nr:hypothetical protein [Phycisphaerales bacterium]MDB5303976.1 hypothetical protein [Phycisphaerales bacterium]